MNFLKEKIKVLRIVRKQYAIAGITNSSSNHPNKNIELINKRIFCGLLALGCLIISHFLYIVYEASDFMEYMNCICATSSTLIVFGCISIIVVQRTLLFEMIERIELLIETRKAVQLICYYITNHLNEISF